MKKFIMLVIVTTVMNFFACQNLLNESPASNSKPEKLNVAKLSDAVDKQSLVTNLEKYSSRIKQIAPDVDLIGIHWSDAFISSLEKETAEGLGINLKTTGNRLITFMLTKKGTKIGYPMLIIIDNLIDIKYYALESNAQLNLVIKDKKVERIPMPQPVYSRVDTLDSCGQDTMDCIIDAYSNHGWVSVWLTIQSAYIPVTAAGIGAACAAKNCF